MSPHLVDVGRTIGRVQSHFGAVGIGPAGVEFTTDGAVAGDYELRCFQDLIGNGAAVATALDHVVPCLSVHADRFVFRVVRAVSYDFGVPQLVEHFDF